MSPNATWGGGSSTCELQGTTVRPTHCHLEGSGCRQRCQTHHTAHSICPGGRSCSGILAGMGQNHPKAVSSTARGLPVAEQRGPSSEETPISLRVRSTGVCLPAPHRCQLSSRAHALLCKAWLVHPVGASEGSSSNYSLMEILRAHLAAPFKDAGKDHSFLPRHHCSC